MSITVKETKYIVKASFLDTHIENEFVYLDEECARAKCSHLLKHSDEIELDSIKLLEVRTATTKLELDDPRRFVVRYKISEQEVTRAFSRKRAEEIIEELKRKDELENVSADYEIYVLEEEE